MDKDQPSNTPEPPEFNPRAFEPPPDPYSTDASALTTDSADTNPLWYTDQNNGPPRLIAKWLLLLFCIVAFALASWLSISALLKHKEQAHQQLNTATLKASTLVHQLESDFLKPAEVLVQAMQAAITNTAGDLPRLKRLLESEQFRNLKPLSFGVAYTEYGYDQNTRLKAPFYRLNSQEVYELTDVSDIYDYTKLAQFGENYDARWFVNGFKNNGGWQEPYYGKILQEWIAEFSLPIYTTDPATGLQKKIGLVYADFSLETVRQMVGRITLDNLTYGYLVSPQGMLVSHPVRFLLGKPMLSAYYTSTENDTQGPTPQSQRIVERVAKGENFFEEFKDDETGQTSLVVHRQVPKSNWSFGIVIPKDSIYGLSRDNKNAIILAVVGLALSLIFGLAYFKYSKLQEDQLPWFLSIITTGFALGITILALFLFWNHNTHSDYARLFTVAETLAARGNTATATDLIPTGILVNSIDFPKPGTASVGGIVWQKFAIGKKSLQEESLASRESSPGVVWPDAKLGSEKMTLLREYKQNGLFVRAWRFAVEINVDRDISKFPFDSSEITLRMRSLPENPAQLVPDFEAYDILIPEVKPGVDTAIKLTYWNILSSYFSVESSARTKYSGTQIADLNKDSEIMFQIKMARLSHVTLISYFIPIFIGSIMMFVVLLIPSDRSTSAVFSTLGYGGTIFFVISMFHVNLRNSEGIDSFTYLESYYIMQHILVMLVSLNGFFLMRGNAPRWIHYHNNLIPKLLYWPSLSIFLTISTLAYFL